MLDALPGSAVYVPDGEPELTGSPALPPNRDGSTAVAVDWPCCEPSVASEQVTGSHDTSASNSSAGRLRQLEPVSTMADRGALPCNTPC